MRDRQTDRDGHYHCLKHPFHFVGRGLIKLWPIIKAIYLINLESVSATSVFLTSSWITSTMSSVSNRKIAGYCCRKAPPLRCLNQLQSVELSRQTRHFVPRRTRTPQRTELEAAVDDCTEWSTTPNIQNSHARRGSLRHTQPLNHDQCAPLQLT